MSGCGVFPKSDIINPTLGAPSVFHPFLRVLCLKWGQKLGKILPA